MVGGSIGGLCAGVALHAIGHDVDLFERREKGLSSRGAGIVVQPELLRLIEGIGGGPLPTTACTHRRTEDADGRVSGHHDMPQRFTSWEAIHRARRALHPAQRYHRGTDVRQCVQEREHVRHFDDAFVFCDARDGGHALCYLIPGDEASVERGSRRLNWVWYENVAEGDALDAVLTDAAGRRRDGALPPGAMSATARQALHAKADRVLEPRFAALVGATREPFLQAIEDQAATRMVHGRAVLLGDAAFVVRPHTAAAAAKAAGDAMALADALHDDPDDIDRALQRHERQRLAYGRSLSAYGVALAHGALTAPGTR